MSVKSRPRVVILGGGFGGLEAAFYLRKRAGDGAEIVLISDRSEFIFKPNTIYVPFGLDPDRLRIGLEEPTSRQQILFMRAAVEGVDLERRTVTADGRIIAWDHLVIATGASTRPAEIPGLGSYARTVGAPEEMLRLRADFEALTAADGRARVLFLVPPENRWASPLYELAFMLDAWLRRRETRDRVELTFATSESAFMEAFGPRLTDVIAGEMEERGIHARTSIAAAGAEPGVVVFREGERIPFDLLVALPPHVPAVAYPGLPANERGFLRADGPTRQVIDHPGVYAVGDAADFPVKQAFLAVLQGDAAAEQIVSAIERTTPWFTFEPMARVVMEQLDTATFAQAPFAAGPTEGSFEIDVEDPRYRVGTTPAWRLGKKIIASYLPWRFRAGEPVHAGIPWEGVGAGIEAATKVLSD